jgi:mono/diheme cytochrome c family protein
VVKLLRSRVALSVVLVGVVLLGVTGFAAGSRSTASATNITVTLGNTGVKLSKTSLPSGAVTFSVTNKGTKPQYFSIGGKKTATLAPGKKATLVVNLKTGTVAYFQSSPKKTGTVKVAAAASGGAATGAAAQIAAGKQVFETAGCKSCHTLKAAGATGTIGPDLDQVKPPVATVIQFVTNGYNGVGAAIPMPSFQGTLSTAKIQDVAAFVYASTH